MTSDTTTCDACGTSYVFTSYKDRCPVCCPEQASDDDLSDEYGQTEFSEPAERKRDSLGRLYSNKKCHPQVAANL
jgi:hypothetical protein